MKNMLIETQFVFLPLLPWPPPFPMEEGRTCFGFLWVIILEDLCSPIVWSFSLNFSVSCLSFTWVSLSSGHGLTLLPKYFFSSDFSPGQHPWRRSPSQGLYKLIMSLRTPFSVNFSYVLKTPQRKPESSLHCTMVTRACCFDLLLLCQPSPSPTDSSVSALGF